MMMVETLGRIVERLPYAEYAMQGGVNVSALKWARYSMAHMRAALDGLIVQGESRALDFGRALHARILEPSVYTEEFKIALPCQVELGSGKNKGCECGAAGRYYVNGTWMCGKHVPDGTAKEVGILTLDEAQACEDMFAAIKSHPIVNVVRQHGGFEASVFGEMEGVYCKGRMDKLILGKSCPDTIVDVKTTGIGGAADWAFANSVKQYGYDVQAAFYVDLVKSVTGSDCVFLWVPIEKEYPFLLRVVQATKETLEIGREKYRQWLSDYKHAVETDEWPGYPAEISLGGLPDYVVDGWAKRQAMGIG